LDHPPCAAASQEPTGQAAGGSAHGCGHGAAPTARQRGAAADGAPAERAPPRGRGPGRGPAAAGAAGLSLYPVLWFGLPLPPRGHAGSTLIPCPSRSVHAPLQRPDKGCRPAQQQGGCGRRRAGRRPARTPPLRARLPGRSGGVRGRRRPRAARTPACFRLWCVSLPHAPLRVSLRCPLSRPSASRPSACIRTPLALCSALAPERAHGSLTAPSTTLPSPLPNECGHRLPFWRAERSICGGPGLALSRASPRPRA
jgi:hypothetical protein